MLRTIWIVCVTGGWKYHPAHRANQGNSKLAKGIS